MSHVIVTKHCNKCNTTKPITDFWKTSNPKSDGYNSWCKVCGKTYAQSPKGKDTQRRYWKSKKGKRLRHNHRQTAKSKMYFRKYRKQWRSQHPQYVKAINAVSDAVKRNIILAASEQLCWECGKPANGYHHFLGYDVTHRLDVFPLCFQCHTNIHRGIASSRNK